jgi:ZIP family zinc transporter
VGVPEAVQAGLWGALAGGALLIGAAVAWFVRVPPLLVSAVMAFGSGVLISAVAFELVAEAAEVGGLAATAGGFAAGAVAYTAANAALARQGARHRKRSGGQQPSQGEGGGSGAAIAVGALLDGVPESAVIGVSLLGGGGVSAATVAAIFVSNLPEGLSSATGMRRAGRSARYVFGIWGGIALASGAAAVAGNLGGQALGATGTAVVTAVAAGAVLAMLTDTMIPEAVEGTRTGTGLVAGAGFLTAFALSRLGG